MQNIKVGIFSIYLIGYDILMDVLQGYTRKNNKQKEKIDVCENLITALHSCQIDLRECHIYCQSINEY